MTRDVYTFYGLLDGPPDENGNFQEVVVTDLDYVPVLVGNGAFFRLDRPDGSASYLRADQFQQVNVTCGPPSSSSTPPPAATPTGDSASSGPPSPPSGPPPAGS